MAVKSPLVSVIVPTYRRQNKLNRALASIVNQTYDNIEIIVVNDDPDNNVNISAKNDVELKILQHEENYGAQRARNTGIAAAKGDYIAFLDDDDAWLPEKIGKQVEKFTSLPGQFGIVYCGRKIVFDEEERPDYPEKRGRIFSDLLMRNYIPSETPLIRSECFSETGLFDETFKSSQDLDMWLRIARKYKVDYVDEILAVSYKNHEDRIGKSYVKLYQGHSRLLEKYGEDFEKHPRALAIRNFDAGLFAYNAYWNTQLARKHFVTAVRHGDADWKMWSVLALTYLPLIRHVIFRRKL